MPSSRTKLGNAGEAIARRHLETLGYTLREANYRCRWGEVDLVMERDGELVFVEVRTKRGGAFGTPEESVTAAKRRRLTATAYHYLQEHDLDVPFRIDLVAIAMNLRGNVERVTHLENVVTGEDAAAE
ncbi:MAG: YraN family protein [Chloroflexota bacterium]|nr:YraN family protein [Chloroflexota bacterium]MDE2968632.1 YraN family protein [Chloroflexota bacterium]